jgi:ABC-type transport system involved in Fe-S cluster assembly fused permease/ATPase subunit
VRDGGIVELGTHAELMRSQGYYAGLIRTQLEGITGHAA